MTLQVYTIPLGGMCAREPLAMGGSGSTYVWGHVDASYRAGMSREESIRFVVNSAHSLLSYHLSILGPSPLPVMVTHGYSPVYVYVDYYIITLSKM